MTRKLDKDLNGFIVNWNFVKIKGPYKQFLKKVYQVYKIP